MRCLIWSSSLLICFANGLVLRAAEPSRPRSIPTSMASRPVTDARLAVTRSLSKHKQPTQLVDWVSPVAFPWPEDDLELGKPGGEEEEPKINYGPPANEPRKTLFQWSYGTTFSGGPPVDDDLQTDRPDFVEASTTVGKGVLQIESGYTYIRNKDPGDDSVVHSAGEVLFRYGVLEDWLELRLGVFPFSESQSATAPTIKTNGVEDLYLGVKLGLTPQEGIWPEMALVPQMTVPTGHDSVTAGTCRAGINWLYGWDVTDFIAIGASTQFNTAIDDGTAKRYTRWNQAITINYNLAEKVGAYTEWFAFFPAGADTAQTEHYADGGITYRITPDMQFDVRAGIGLSDASADYFLGTGFSIRIK